MGSMHATVGRVLLLFKYTHRRGVGYLFWEYRRPGVASIWELVSSIYKSPGSVVLESLIDVQDQLA
jgi:hypothetical protein